MFDLLSEGFDSMASNVELQAMKDADPLYKEFLDGMSMMAPLISSDAEIDAQPALRRASTKVKKVLLKGALKGLSGTATG